MVLAIPALNEWKMERKNVAAKGLTYRTATPGSEPHNKYYSMLFFPQMIDSNSFTWQTKPDSKTHLSALPMKVEISSLI